MMPAPLALSPSRRLRPLGPLVVLAATLFLGVARADDYTDVDQLIRGGQLTQAMGRVERHLAAKPRDPQMRFLKGVIQTESGQTAEAMATFTRLAEDYPELPEPYNNLAALHAGQGQLEKARESLEMAIRLKPNYATAHENLGDVHARLAAQAYGRALQHESGNASVPPKLAAIRALLAPPAKGAKSTGERP